MRQLEKRGREIASARQLIALERLIDIMMQEYPGARIEADQSRIRISGTGLVKRWLTDSSLRFVGGLVKMSAK